MENFFVRSVFYGDSVVFSSFWDEFCGCTPPVSSGNTRTQGKDDRGKGSCMRRDWSGTRPLRRSPGRIQVVDPGVEEAVCPTTRQGVVWRGTETPRVLGTLHDTYQDTHSN